MKKLVFIVVLLGSVLAYGCQGLDDKTDKKVVGKWKTVEADVNIEDAPEKMKEGFEKMVLETKYEFGEDKSFKMISAMETIEGTWEYKEDINALIISNSINDNADIDTFKIEASDKNSFSLVSDMGADGSIRFKIEKEEEKKEK